MFNIICTLLSVLDSPVCVLQTEYARLEGGKCVYRIHRSPMCEYMINFIHKLKHLPEKYMMNSVLENFTILQVKYSELWLLSSTFNLTFTHNVPIKTSLSVDICDFLIIHKSADHYGLISKWTVLLLRW